MNKIIIYLVGISTLFMMVESLQAQVCWSKFDPENCQYRVISEFGLSRRVNPPLQSLYYNGSNSLNLDLNVGMDYKIREKIGLGAVLFADFDQFGRNSRYGFRPRVSYYPNDKWDLNFSTGMILSSSNSIDYLSKNGGISVEAGANFKNYVGLYSRVDFLNRTDGQRETSYNLGIKAAGPAGLISTGGCVVIGGVAVGLAVLLFIGILGGL